MGAACSSLDWHKLRHGRAMPSACASLLGPAPPRCHLALPLVPPPPPPLLQPVGLQGQQGGQPQGAYIMHPYYGLVPQPYPQPFGVYPGAPGPAGEQGGSGMLKRDRKPAATLSQLAWQTGLHFCGDKCAAGQRARHPSWRRLCSSLPGAPALQAAPQAARLPTRLPSTRLASTMP